MENVPLIETNRKNLKFQPKWIILACLLCASAFFAFGYYLKYEIEKLKFNQKLADEDWTSFKALHNKEYSAFEESSRKATFLRNRDEIDRHNADPNHTYRKSLYHFHDWTEEELKSLMGSQMSALEERETILVAKDPNFKAPPSIDLRSSPCMPAIKNQGNCGSCWVFSSVTPLEYQYCMKYGHKVSLSEQQLVDCSESNYGCNGGWFTKAWTYLNGTGGIESSSDYPYTAKGDQCQFEQSKVVARLSGPYYSGQTDQDMMNDVARTGPLSVALYANDNFMSYSSGIFYDPNCPTTVTNHAVVIVGYGSDSLDYWIVRNSWGMNWGLNGYILIRRGVNQCNINCCSAYPAVN